MRNTIKRIDSKNKIDAVSFKKYVLIGICGILAVSSVFMTVATATSSVEVSSLKKEEGKLYDQKRYLEDTLIRTLSVNQLQAKSGEMGYVKPTTLVYVAPAEAVAKLP